MSQKKRRVRLPKMAKLKVCKTRNQKVQKKKEKDERHRRKECVSQGIGENGMFRKRQEEGAKQKLI